MALDINIVQLFQTISYSGLFLWLVMYNLLFFAPLPPEEIVLLTIGYVFSLGHLNPFIAGAIIIFTSVLVDNLFFLLSFKGNAFVNRIIDKFGRKTFAKYKRKMEENLPRTLLILAFIPKVRFFGPVISGSLKIKWRRFLGYGMLANSLYVAVYVSLGYFFHKSITQLMKDIEPWTHVIIYVGLLVVGLLLVYFIRKKFLGYRRRSRMGRSHTR